ncbi:MAG: glycosyltransferase [Planctomycetes bacterium]|nr:glycosyltransferase [Planctomycetota bacterium]
MRKLLIINNIPTPYRTYMFHKLYDVGREHGVETTIAFQAEREARRVWKAEDFALRTPHFYSSGLRFWSKRPRKFFTYPTVNIDILRRVMSGAYDWILYAPLNSMNGWFVSWLPAGRSKKVVWSESNLHSTRYMSGFARAFKRFLLAPCHVLACPGERALEYVYTLRPKARALPVIHLPNLVDTALFEQRVGQLRSQRDAIRRELDFDADQQLILGVGRMVDYKGFGQVLEAAAQVDGNYRLMFLGEGERLDSWRERVRALKLERRVTFAGQQPEAEVVRRLAAADWFIHPALEDPSPLVTIEAATAGLPLAVANQTGNAPETVEPGQSGFRFDASCIGDVAETLRKMVSMPIQQRLQFGARSRELAQERFSPDLVSNRFFAELLRLSPARSS